MTRTLLTASELRALINRALDENEHCKGCEVIGSIATLPSPLSDGGNWSRSVAVGGRPADPQRCGEEAHDLILAIAARYNVRDA